VPATHIKGKTIERFAQTLEKSTNGHYKVSLFPAGQLMSPTEEIAAVARGQVQMAAPFLNYFASVEGGYNLFAVPMLYGGYEDLAKAVDGPAGQDLLARLSARGLHGITYWFEAPIHLFANRVVSKVEEVAGLKLRVFPSEILSASTRALAGVPTSIPGPEIYLALQQGIADGAWTTPTYAVTIKMADVQKSMTKAYLSYGGYAVIVNKRFFDSQAPDKQQAIVAAAIEARGYNRKQVLEDLAATDAALKGAGMNIVELSADERKRWQTKLQPVYDGLNDDLKGLIAKSR
jgi:C4-dicarboxylate-binding protein DctP